MEDASVTAYPKQLKIHWVTTADSTEFAHLSWSLTHSSLVALDAEWKPLRTHQHPPVFPTVTLLQLACRLTHSDDSLVFLLDLLSLPLASVYVLLREMFVSPSVLKLGFRFKQDLVYLSSTFCAQGYDPGFVRVEPYIDITSVYHFMQPKQPSRRALKDFKSLAAICAELLGFTLSKELQCSDWSNRPLTEEQKVYAAVDAQCLLDIFDIFQAKVDKEGDSLHNLAKLHSISINTGLRQILEEQGTDKRILTPLCNASHIIREAISELSTSEPGANVVSDLLWSKTISLDDSLLKIVHKYGSKILLNESDRKPKNSRKKAKKRLPLDSKQRIKHPEDLDSWQGPPPWELLIGGDGCPKFLCDVMVEGLAKHLRCVGIDAAVPINKRPETRELIEQTHREKRVLLTRDAKLLRHEYLIKNQIYRVKSLLKNDQLLEVIETFQLKVSEHQLMSRCTKCNGRFIQRPLNMEEAQEAAKGFQKIPDCLFDKNLEFWQCTDCNQLYWEGTQYHNAVQKFINVCKLSD
ncbi:hypothetical protein V2J09_000882 [Rumex salicifolius]